MISQTRSAPTSPAWHDDFLVMVPAITRHATFRFRHFPPEAKEEAVQEVVANCCVAYSRLVEQGKPESASATSLAEYAVKQYFNGRRVGTRTNVRDVMSPSCQVHKGVAVQSLHSWDEKGQRWKEILVEDRNATPADLAASRIDFPAWLATLSRRDRRIALRLADGDAADSVAQRFGLSQGRISQLRREFIEAWRAFHGELWPDAAAVPA